TFKTLCLLNYALMIRHDYDVTSSLRRGALQLWYQSQMVNTRTYADFSAAVQNALQTLLPQIHIEIREEFCTSSGPSNAGDSSWISHMEKIFDVMGCEDAFKTRLAVYKFEGNALAWWKAYKQAKGGDACLITMTWVDFKKLFFLQFFPRAEQERLKREYHSIRQTNTKTSTEFMQRFLRLAGFFRATAGTEEEQAKNFQNFGYGRDQRNRGQQSNRSAISGSQQSRGPSEGYSYP
nr:zinc finger, CCHC-type, retrotransposon Gag domain protein [Tanacetum cinerariifolium]